MKKLIQAVQNYFFKLLFLQDYEDHPTQEEQKLILKWRTPNKCRR